MYSAGGFGSPTFWAMLAALSAVDRAAYFRQSQYDPAYQQWRQQAVRDPGTASRLAQLGDQAAAQPVNAGASAPSTSSGFGIVWMVLFIGGAVFVLLWVARRRAASGPATGVPPGLAVAAREGVNISAGWQLSQVVEYNSTLMSVKQVTIDHTHYETVQGCEAATELYGSVFRPTIHKEIYSFEDLGRAFAEMHDNTQTGIPIIRVATDMPESLAKLTP